MKKTILWLMSVWVLVPATKMVYLGRLIQSSLQKCIMTQTANKCINHVVDTSKVIQNV